MRRWSFVMALGVAIGAILLTGQAARPVAAQDGQVRVEWLGHMFFRLTSPSGVVVVTSPWLTNRDSPIDLERIGRVDLILAPNAHNDDYGQTTEIANRTGARVIAPAGLGAWQVANRGLNAANLIGAVPGETHMVSGIQIDVVRNEHDNTIREDPSVDGGPAIGFFITFENGYVVYFAASSAPYTDMRDFGRRFQPDLALLNSFNNDAQQFGDMVEYLLADNQRTLTIVPTHRPAGALELFEYSYELEERALPVTYFTPAVGQVYTY